MVNDKESSFPSIPSFTQELIEQCNQSKDFRPILFEWYKYVGLLCNWFASISLDSPGLKKIEPIYFIVLTGLLNRCSRLMLANIRLSCTNRYGETTKLIDRAITETAIKIHWLCVQDTEDRFTIYIADGLKKDLELKKHIELNACSRNGEYLIIERQMLESIQKCIHLSGLTEEQIRNTKKLPDMASICCIIGLNDLGYVTFQRMSSHSIHGTWTDLVIHYLREDETQGLVLRDHDVETQDVQYIAVMVLIYNAMHYFITYIIKDLPILSSLDQIINDGIAKINAIATSSWDHDFDIE